MEKGTGSGSSDESIKYILQKMKALHDQIASAPDDASRNELRKKNRRVQDELIAVLANASATVISQHAPLVAMDGRLKKAAHADPALLSPLMAADRSAFDEVITQEASQLDGLAHGSSMDRYLAGTRLLTVVGHTHYDQTVSELLLPVAKRLFRDENTRVWRTGAVCIASLFHHPAAREYLDRLMPTTLVRGTQQTSIDETWNIHAGRHALAALGKISATDHEYATQQAEAVFAPLHGETAKAFRRRRNVWYEASFAFALPDFVETDPEIALKYFQLLAAYPINKGENFAIHNNIATVSGEIVDYMDGTHCRSRDEWLQAIREWHASVAPYFNDLDDPDLWNRYRRHTVLNQDVYQLVGARLTATPERSRSDEEMYARLDKLPAQLEKLAHQIGRSDNDILRRVDSFILVANAVRKFFDTDTSFWSLLESSETTEKERDRFSTRWSQVASSVKAVVSRIVGVAMEGLTTSDPQVRAEAKLYLVYGIQLLVTVFDALPDASQRYAIRDELFGILRNGVAAESCSFLTVKYVSVAVERILDRIWVSGSGSKRCAEVHDLAREVQALDYGEKILKKVVELCRSDGALSCIVQSCQLLSNDHYFQELPHTCTLCAGRWKPLDSILPTLSATNGILTNTAEVEDDARGICGVVSDLHGEFFDNPEGDDQFEPSRLTWGALATSSAPRHLLRDAWHDATAEERTQTHLFLYDVAAELIARILERSRIPIDGSPTVVARNFAQAMTQPVGAGTGKRLRTTLLGVLQSPPGPPPGRDQFREVQCFRSLEEAHHHGATGELPWPDTPLRSLRIAFENRGKAATPPVSLPWYVIIGLVQALSQDENEAWHKTTTVTIRRSYEPTESVYRIDLFPKDVPWVVPEDSLLRSNDLPYDSGAHKVAFWLYWLDHIFGQGRKVWAVSHPTGVGGDALSIAFPLSASI
jgi:hypothetical protein